ncbi:hypothetical protein LSH36_290g03093 [Paralvinella palmiformis]|uniref:Target of rapamycin complex subunit lst8 n=1 Tax=Paralvinella palmiformis TaxID=53620 RepID=A0AAD9JJ56_9ANNE|nr:hypothetical protein LSH36_290g03093 [Paralvinella palmiformis]
MSSFGGSKDPVILATAGYDHTIRLWQAHSGLCHRTVQHPDSIPEVDASIQSISIDPEGTYMAAVNNKGNCYVWSLSGGRHNEPTKLHPKTKLVAHDRQVLKCLFSPDSTLLATTSADTTVKIWRTADFSLMTELKEQNQRWVWDCAFSGDSQYIITADGNSRIPATGVLAIGMTKLLSAEDCAAVRTTSLSHQEAAYQAKGEKQNATTDA